MIASVRWILRCAVNMIFYMQRAGYPNWNVEQRKSPPQQNTHSDTRCAQELVSHISCVQDETKSMYNWSPCVAEDFCRATGDTVS